MKHHAGWRRLGWKGRLAIIGLTGLLPVLAAAPASAADGGGPVTCATGDSCTIKLDHMVHFGGWGYSPGASNIVVDIAPPPCSWNPIGNAQTGSEYVINEAGGVAPPPGSLFDTAQTYQQAKTLLATEPVPDGEWYILPIAPGDNAAQQAACLAEPLFFWDVPGAALPGIEIPPVTLAQLALGKLYIPKAGNVYLSPTTRVSYSNLPVFMRVTFAGGYQTLPDGEVYATDYAQLGNNAATVWVEANPLQISASGAATVYNNCGYSGSTEMVRDPGAVASTGANGVADCGATFRDPGNWTLTATLTWRACWAPEVEVGAPPAGCRLVPGANLDPDNWAAGVTVHEIQAANGSD